MISGLEAVALLKETTLRQRVVELSRGDQNLRVRQAALEALEQIGSASTETNVSMHQ
jgi:HEAT repeat protein